MKAFLFSWLKLYTHEFKEFESTTVFLFFNRKEENWNLRTITLRLPPRDYQSFRYDETLKNCIGPEGIRPNRVDKSIQSFQNDISTTGQKFVENAKIEINKAKGTFAPERR